jgi:hypothetical protein
MKSFIVLPAVAVAVVVLAFTLLACSASPPEHATGSGGNGAGSGGASASGGSSSDGATASGGSAGGGGMAGEPGDDLLFVPDGLSNTLQAGQQGVTLTLIAFTLVQGTTGPELYAAVRNDGQTPSCEPGMMTAFFDKTGQPLETVGSVLQTAQFYRLDPDTILPCIGPGQIAMSVTTDLPKDIVIANLGYLMHSFPTFTVDGIVPVDGITVANVTAASSANGGTYSGTLTNDFDVTVSAPQVTIFPLNRVGRPLGAAMSSATIDIPAGGNWSFETNAVNDLGVNDFVSPAVTVSN